MVVVRPHKTEERTCLQPSLVEVPKLPARLVVAGPSGSGKTQLLQALILDFWKRGGKSCFERIYVFFSLGQRRPCVAPGQELLQEAAPRE